MVFDVYVSLAGKRLRRRQKYTPIFISRKRLRVRHKHTSIFI
jgi:hypothetical protein